MFDNLHHAIECLQKQGAVRDLKVTVDEGELEITVDTRNLSVGHLTITGSDRASFVQFRAPNIDGKLTMFGFDPFLLGLAPSKVAYIELQGAKHETLGSTSVTDLTLQLKVARDTDRLDYYVGIKGHEGNVDGHFSFLEEECEIK
jgi:hypothetical protein